ncbi:DUF1194 domain-containing protein [Tranquillimonas alkanivorans]|uniref:VWFA domain-containing protein n=1 Tax=Tranquillimonas alkanivorans TaxID=441119 RepID=A0A1I5NEW4_9RHOB|nr:DUF1194 domain-containing protein [Tranquillimonas alkanivorans]SFP20338.1 Protein of unknown function [Tranquillimonas alkanivorans]
MLRALLAAIALLAALPVRAQPVEVDVELVLMVDVSRSMTPRELEIQRRGYAEALTSGPVIQAIRGGLLQRIAVTYVEWAGSTAQRPVVTWRLLRGEEDARAFADILTTDFNAALRRTSISGALLAGAEMIETNGYKGLRRVIDISGDGPNNEGGPVEPARDSVLSRGIVINGLPLMTREGMGARWHLDDLDLYYEHCVIGGPGAFVIPVTTWDGFAEAVRRKLVLEIAGTRPPPRIVPAQHTGVTPEGYDCSIGETMWRDDRFNRFTP